MTTLLITNIGITIDDSQLKLGNSAEQWSFKFLEGLISKVTA